MKLDVKVRATYDPDSDVLYIYIPNEKEHKPMGTMAVNPSTLADLDDKGTIIGLEFLQYSKVRSKPTPKVKRNER
jgi:uncharacterized protein YuzE